MLRPNELKIAANAPNAGCTPEAARQYTRWLATHHYENFNVVSWLLPKELHQHFYNLYAYCRWADDLGDEIPDSQRALQLLDWWKRELDDCYDGHPSHPVFVALRETILAKDIPKQPFADLLKAFRQDQNVKRYPAWDAVIDYCVYSANPVGRLVLYLCGYRDEQRQRLSDATCTALQLANFWQDVSRDLEIGRVYIPLDIAAAHGLSETDIVHRRFDHRYIVLMKDLIARTRALFAEGSPLSKMVDSRLSIDLEMFTRGGLAVLDAIESSGYDTLHHRPSIGKAKQASLLGRAVVTHLVAKDSRSSSAPAAAGDLIAQSYENCYRIARASRSNFYYAFFLLPRAKRDGLAALYAFMRLVDDANPSPATAAQKPSSLTVLPRSSPRSLTPCVATTCPPAISTTSSPVRKWTSPFAPIPPSIVSANIAIAWPAPSASPARMCSAFAIPALSTSPKNSASPFSSPTSFATFTMITLSAAFTCPKKISPASMFPPKTSPAAQLLSAFASYCASKPTAPGNAMRKAPRS